jgi:hypothetical protein
MNAHRFEIQTVVLFIGAARVPAAGSHHLTMTAAEGIQVAHAFPVPRRCRCISKVGLIFRNRVVSSRKHSAEMV